jgi:hypothetical protein
MPRDEKRKEEPMSGLFDDDEDNAAAKLKRAGARRLLFDPEIAEREVRPTIIASPETTADAPTEEQRRKAEETLKRELQRQIWRKQGIDIDDADRERLARRKFDDNKTESQKEREGNIARRLREQELRMREGLHDPRLWDPRNWSWTHRRPWDI